MVEKNCKEHGKFISNHFWDDPEIYQGLLKINTLPTESANIAVAVTYKCNLDCPICYANANETKINDISLKDIEKLTKEYDVVFLSGGEPTVRKDLYKIISTLRKNKKKVVMFSNGLKMADKRYVRLLKKAGIRNVIIQFDSIIDSDNRYMRGKNLLATKMQAIRNAAEFNLSIYSQSVILKNKNFKELGEIVKFGLNESAIKAVIFNSLWQLGRYNEKDFVSSSDILIEISRIFKLQKSDWIDSTRLYCNVDKIIALFGKRSKVFGKCNIKLMVFWNGRYCVPITKIFSVDKINCMVERADKQKSRLLGIVFLGYFIFSQLILNFFFNRNYRQVVYKTLGNLPLLFKKDFLMFSPFKYLSVQVMPLISSIDYDFVGECNFKAISSEDFSFDPACIHRIKALRKEEKKKRNMEQKK